MFKKIKFIGIYDYTVILTYLSLLSALFGIVKATQGMFNRAILCLLVSGFCDAFDGIVARTKKNRNETEKEFGIQIDSLCDVIAFGVFPALLGFFMGLKGTIGIIITLLYALCAVIRLAYFNVLEGRRQKTETGCAKTYRGLPVTSIAIIFPFIYGLGLCMPEHVFIIVLHVTLAVTAFLFILDFTVPKPDWTILFRQATRNRKER